MPSEVRRRGHGGRRCDLSQANTEKGACAAGASSEAGQARTKHEWYVGDL